MNPPDEILKTTIDTGIKKATAPWHKLILFGLLAGAFIAFAAAASNMAAMNLLTSPDTYGLGRLVAGLVFIGGLACVVIAGAELFTGNSLMIVALFSKKISTNQLLRNWLIVLGFNLIGGFIVALLLSWTGIFQTTPLYGAITIKIAAGKTAMGFFPALISGILCNILVCLAVWMAAAAKSVGGKISAIFFPILFFVTIGFEHSIANAFYIPAGLLAQSDPTALAKAEEIGANLSTLNAAGIFQNLTPVILGNILGGSLIATIYFLSLKSQK